MIGGKNDRRRLRSVEKYDLGSKAWKFMTWLTRPVFSHAGAAHSGKVCMLLDNSAVLPVL